MSFGVAALQLDLARGDNRARLADEVAALKRRLGWVDMIVLPELAAFGPGVAHAEPREGPTEAMFADMARAAGVWLVNGSLYEADDDRIYNTATVFAPDGRVAARHRKLYPFLPYEVGVTPGTAPAAFDVPGVGRFGVAICYDIWFPEVARALARDGAEVIVNPVLTNTIDRDVEVALVRATAAANQLYVVSVNVAGAMGMGRSAVFGPGGEAVHLAESAREIIAVDLDLAHVRRCRATGWHGLGQVLKSYRDGPLGTEMRAPALDALGPLEPRPHTRPEGLP